MVDDKTIFEDVLRLFEDSRSILSDYLYDDDIESIYNKSKDKILRPYWVALLKEAKEEISFINFHVATCDGILQYNNLTKVSSRDRKESLVPITNTLNKLNGLLEKDSYLSGIISDELRCYIFDSIDKHYNVLEKNKMGNNPRYLSSLDLKKLLSATTEVIANLDDRMLSQNDSLSNTKGQKGLVTFYTNSLCEITEHQFKRLCYKEIAEVAGFILSSSISAENVRLNYQNAKKRLA